MQPIHDVIDQVTATLAEVAQSDAVVGTPIEVGAVTLVPVSRVMAGFGGGVGQGEGDMARGKHNSKGGGSGKGTGVGSGGGAKVRPVAVIVFSENGVEVLPIGEKPNKLEKFLDQLPDLMERFKNLG